MLHYCDHYITSKIKRKANFDNQIELYKHRGTKPNRRRLSIYRFVSNQRMVDK